ncbi:hypothetical protein [Streptomyces sp. NPDC089919]|uniref:hypothetical protein n=1 Tax=Streptomyces sp. NPDC089919 TaxID=3155188 RepID=UPI00344381F2
MSNKLIAQGVQGLEAETAQRATRVPRAADATRDPALPHPASEPIPAAEPASLLPAEFDVAGIGGLDTLAQIERLEDAYRAADRAEGASFQLAKMRGSVAKGELIRLLLDRNANVERGMSVGAYAETLGIDRSYVYKLMDDAKNIRDLTQLIDETQTPIIASQAAFLAPLYRSDPEAAGLVLEGAKATGKLSLASLTSAAQDLGLVPAAPEKRTPEPKPTPSKPTAEMAGQLSFADAYRALAPRRIEELVQEDPDQVLAQVKLIESELARVLRRVETAKKTARRAMSASSDQK